MAQAQLIQGSGDELLLHLQQHRNRKNLMLIIPDEAGQENLPAVSKVQQTFESSMFRNGIPLFPTQDAAQAVTEDLVRQLLEDE